MWEFEHRIQTTAPPAAIWRLWADVENWGTWNADIEQISIDGPFAAGAEIVMSPAGQDKVRLRITDLAEQKAFTDEARMDGLTLRTVHRLDRHDGQHTTITYRMEITGPAAGEIGPQIGPAITADWPDTMAALASRARGE